MEKLLLLERSFAKGGQRMLVKEVLTDLERKLGKMETKREKLETKMDTRFGALDTSFDTWMFVGFFALGVMVGSGGAQR